MREFLDFYEMMNEAIGHATARTTACFMVPGQGVVFSDEKPRWLKRIKEGHVLPWMVRRRPLRLSSHAPVTMNRMLCSLRVQTHQVK